VRSDQLAVQLDGKTVPPDADAPKDLPNPAQGTLTEGACWIDYEF